MRRPETPPEKKRTRTSPEQRPFCPEGHDQIHVNSNGPNHWWCFLCRKRFPKNAVPQQAVVLKAWKHSFCPRCDSHNVEKEIDGTWVCWNCDWYEDGEKTRD